MQKTLTSFDVAAVVLELGEKLKGARIRNIYQVKGRTLIFKLHQSNQPPFSLLIESGRRLHLTSYEVVKPRIPPAFCMALRKHLRNGIITEISQYEFERVITISIKAQKDEFKVISEFFGEGNVILIDAEGIIQQAFRFKRMRDRHVIRGARFEHAPSSGKNPNFLERSGMAELRKFKHSEVVKGLTKLLSIGGLYAEEILLRARIDKNKRCDSLDDSELDSLFLALKELLSPFAAKKLEPCLFTDNKGNWIEVAPIPLGAVREYKCRKYESFNEALDDFYSKKVAEQESAETTREVDEAIAKQERILVSQRESLQKAKQDTEFSRKVGDIIYSHFHDVHTILHRISSEKKSGKTWRQILATLEKEKKNQQAPLVYFQSLDPKSLTLTLKIRDLPFSLSLRASAQENAANYYEKAKKTRRKAAGAEKAIGKTLSRISELENQKTITVTKIPKTPIKRRRKAWYEKFRWFYTSEELLAVGGKDAVTNEILIKKHVKSDDIVFHGDIQGAPFVVLKTEGRMPSQTSIIEAAQFAAAHSRAWKFKFEAVDVYWVHPHQVSKTPPSGTYLQKGAFMVRGKKNFVRQVQLRVAVGYDMKMKQPELIGGPKEALENRGCTYVEIAPGEDSSRKLAVKMRQALGNIVPKDRKEALAKTPLEEIQIFIPYGKGRLVNRDARARGKSPGMYQ